MMEITVSGTTTIRKFILVEGSEMVWPPNSKIIKSEVVVNSSDTEVLEVWVAVPVQNPLTPHMSVPTAPAFHQQMQSVLDIPEEFEAAEQGMASPPELTEEDEILEYYEDDDDDYD